MRQVEIPCCGAACDEGQRMRKSSRATGDFIFFHFFMQSLQQSSLPNELGSLSLSLLWLDLESRYLISFLEELLWSWPPQLVVTIFFKKNLWCTPRNAQLGSSCVGFVFWQASRRVMSVRRCVVVPPLPVCGTCLIPEGEGARRNPQHTHKYIQHITHRLTHNYTVHITHKYTFYMTHKYIQHTTHKYTGQHAKKQSSSHKHTKHKTYTHRISGEDNWRSKE